MTKRILITGENSYIGNQLAEWLSREPEEYTITKKSVRNDKWKEIIFSNFDVVVHVAGIAHQDTKKDQEDLYYKVNTELTVAIATKAKSEGVKQFIFMSSIIVYGAGNRAGKTRVITSKTIPKPVNFYGNSKLLAERGIQPLQSEKFNITILRPPMIYGEKSKGNYPLLAKFAKITPIFPHIDNQRSMLHIDNLCEFIRIIIEQNRFGTFYPQNKEYVKTSELVKTIREVHGRNTKLTKLFNPIIMSMLNINIVNKIFGDLVYEKKMSNYSGIIYQIRTFKESVMITELENDRP